MKRIKDLLPEMQTASVLGQYCPVNLNGKNRVNILALGDVGMTVLMGLRLLGDDVISSIGICDINKANVDRLEMEINQINYPFDIQSLPFVTAVAETELFDCDLLIFCASKSVPPIGAAGDVRMLQLDANREIIGHYGSLAKAVNYSGLVAVVSDPVDPLCAAFLDASGLKPCQIQGYGLGVMNARALYFAEKDARFAAYRDKGRAFGPHGSDLVIADNIECYDDVLSRELTELAVTANLKVRDLGYKPYIAPALSSAALSILLTLRGQWHYGSLYMGDQSTGAFLGIKNRMTDHGPEYEDEELDEGLFDRIQKAYENLCSLR